MTESAVSAPATPGARLLVPRSWIAVGLFTGFAFVPLLAGTFDDAFLLVIATRIVVFAIAAVALDLILGYGAMVSFGHAAYLGIGAYSVAILSEYGITDLGAHVLGAIAAAALFAFVTGGISLRTRGVYFIMITLAFGQMAYFFFVSLSSFGGDDGLTLDHRSTVMGSAVLENDLIFFYVALAILVLIFAFCTRLVGSRFGRVLTGTRENALRMQSIGFPLLRYRLTAFVISGCLASIAGVLLANQAEFVSPAFMNWHRSGELIVMVVLGGVGNLTGAVVGAIVALLLEDWLSLLTEHWRLLFGLILVMVVLYSPGGMTGLVQRLKGGHA